MPGSFITKDLEALLAPSDFGSGGVYWSECPGKEIPAIFDYEDVEIEIGEGVTEIRPQAMVTARSADFDGINRGQSITILDDTFTIQHWMDDGTGQIDIYLERV